MKILADVFDRRTNLAFFTVLLMLMPLKASAFWLLGFSSADTLPSGGLGAIAGTGGQLSRIGAPAKDSSTAFIPHAGFRIGVSDDVDLGYRLVQVTLPFSSVGSTLGGEIDAKYRLTAPSDATQFAIIGGLAYANLDISGQSKEAWGPGIDLIGSRVLTEQYTIFSELRYVATNIPTAQGGAGANYFTAGGIGAGVKIKLTQQTSLVPEIGLFNINGEMLGMPANGYAVQVGAVLSMRIW